MVAGADKIGSLVTVGRDSRVTKIGRFLRKYRLDEIPQVIDVLAGTMSYVGTRPEVPKYVSQYTNEMKATLLLPAGITSEASIRYKDEAELLDDAVDVDKVYVERVLPGKMEYNLWAIEKFSFTGEVATMFRTVFAVMGRDYSEKKTRV
jgi:lipopolysaccharide/colanic/teichoic acid biosynthesis glycosyltransferase